MLREIWTCTIMTAPNMDDVFASLEDVTFDMELPLIHYKIVDSPMFAAYLVTCIFVKGEYRDA